MLRRVTITFATPCRLGARLALQYQSSQTNRYARIQAYFVALDLYRAAASNFQFKRVGLQGYGQSVGRYLHSVRRPSRGVIHKLAVSIAIAYPQ